MYNISMHTSSCYTLKYRIERRNNMYVCDWQAQTGAHYLYSITNIITNNWQPATIYPNIVPYTVDSIKSKTSHDISSLMLVTHHRQRIKTTPHSMYERTPCLKGTEKQLRIINDHIRNKFKLFKNYSFYSNAEFHLNNMRYFYLTEPPLDISLF